MAQWLLWWEIEMGKQTPPLPPGLRQRCLSALADAQAASFAASPGIEWCTDPVEHAQQESDTAPYMTQNSDPPAPLPPIRLPAIHFNCTPLAPLPPTCLPPTQLSTHTMVVHIAAAARCQGIVLAISVGLGAHALSATGQRLLHRPCAARAAHCNTVWRSIAAQQAVACRWHPFSKSRNAPALATVARDGLAGAGVGLLRVGRFSRPPRAAWFLRKQAAGLASKHA